MGVEVEKTTIQVLQQASDRIKQVNTVSHTAIAIPFELYVFG